MSEPLPKRTIDRREFLIAGGRYAGVGALLGLAAFQEVKRRRIGDDPDCVRVRTCRECIEFDGCRLPKAKRYRA